jgi:hypothetical protein
MTQHPDLVLPPAGERRWDLELRHPVQQAITAGVVHTIGHLVERIEVKTDSYARRNSRNFFMELRTRVAGVPGELLGGPWRALADGCTTFVYLYHNPARAPGGVAYWFHDLPALVRELDLNRPDYEIRRVRGGRLTSVGLLVPRRGLRDLCTRVVYP